ncbi:unnamed protein product [Pieris macdunnoughi]|uniref:Uncharacterized protein n=1 Tax=Pieris macdunnoughi TaxID=345717 RepID=A0A821XXS0_9NEOP|nr:unnamed protein product [Pieris macdunnoughi]
MVSPVYNAQEIHSSSQEYDKFGCGSVMVWGGVSLDERTIRLVPGDCVLKLTLKMCSRSCLAPDMVWAQIFF